MPAATTARRSIVAGIVLAAVAALGVAPPSHAGHAPMANPTLTAAEQQAKDAAAPVASGHLLADGVKLPYLRQGEGEVVVILPDSAEGLESWRGPVETLGQRYLAIAYLRRTGPSPKARAPVNDQPPITPIPKFAASIDADRSLDPNRRDAWAMRDLLLVISSLTASPVHVVGEGEGARLALRFALEYPERVKSLVISAPDPHWFARNAAVEAARHGAVVPPAVDTSLACRRLWRLSVPVLVLTGDRDPRSFGSASALRCIHTVRTLEIRAAAFHPHEHAPAEFNRAVSRFLERQRLTAGEP